MRKDITIEKYARVIDKNKFEAIEKASLNNNMLELADWNDNQDLLSQLLNLLRHLLKCKIKNS